MKSPTFSPRVEPAFEWPPRVSVVLPTYNESGNIGRLITALRESGQSLRDLELVVVDDNSPDHTADVARDAGPGVRVIVRTEERGLATAVRRGIEEAKGDVDVVMDTDFN